MALPLSAYASGDCVPQTIELNGHLVSATKNVKCSSFSRIQHYNKTNHSIHVSSIQSKQVAQFNVYYGDPQDVGYMILTPLDPATIARYEKIPQELRWILQYIHVNTDSDMASSCFVDVESVSEDIIQYKMRLSGTYVLKLSELLEDYHAQSICTNRSMILLGLNGPVTTIAVQRTVVQNTTVLSIPTGRAGKPPKPRKIGRKSAHFSSHLFRHE